MRALVTGATGFVGSHLAETLRRQGIEVTALVRSPARAAGLVAQGVRTVTGDLHQLPALREAVRDADLIFHVAGLVAARDEAEFLAGNRDGTRNLLEAVPTGARPRLVLVSSMPAGGPPPRRGWQGAPARPRAGGGAGQGSGGTSDRSGGAGRAAQCVTGVRP